MRFQLSLKVIDLVVPALAIRVRGLLTCDLFHVENTRDAHSAARYVVFNIQMDTNVFNDCIRVFLYKITNDRSQVIVVVLDWSASG